ncbi:MAG: maleylpyruvate isomerase family mycothiol-dependent enzyme [Acidimicrobiia bacterium]|nr:maleylpyruvate isomerase family mycothiol-dependent enzyme [Acidimicrobiia bacterium]MDH5522334.1 maleylpyruvate isomerase family mycothiol-dependent enzyme [Acidimicrobiia bacterium]
MSAHRQAVDNVVTSFVEFQSLIESLSADDLEVQSLCPDWNVRGVILHVLGIEDCLSGWKPQADDEMPPFAEVGPFMAEHAGDDPVRLAELGRDIFGRRRRELETASDDDLARLCMSPVGQVPYGTFVAVRNFDIWVHHRDITTPLGRDSDDSGPAAEAAMDQIHSSLGYIVGKKIGLPDGMSIAFQVHGPVERTMAVSVDGRAKVVPEIAGSPSVEVTADSLTFVQLACGRIDPEGAISTGRIGWTGDDEWGGRAARNLAFTI